MIRREPRRQRRAVALGLLGAVLLLGGCASDRQASQLESTVSAYGATLRWGDFESALAFVDPKVLARHPMTRFDMARYAQVRVSTYDTQGVLPSPPGEFRQIVAIGLINRNTQVERGIIDRQTWRYDAKARKWWLESGLPDITQGE
ncbi:MAG: hypothetical protein KGI40_06515 [Xanthomonadaceae bacterium]|nr:hypothetical protein [Xanthomonadaceae bacterium]MDE1958720.1 hypothetical protein [Xanthomonadaceae bacterium]MDE2177836.1 hypothetical protein [Xanthomonadaceae bacterium]MDE2245067.1 hypothetical protein [Xanthomonadaceae bacterium]